VLIDSPNILGRGAWTSSSVSTRARGQFAQTAGKRDNAGFRAQLLGRMVMGALAEAALMIAEAEDRTMARKQAEELVEQLFSAVG